MVVGLSGLVLADGVFGGVHVQREVDPGICQLAHAVIVVCAVVDGVDTDGVDLEFHELGDVSLAGVGVGERISGI